MRHWSSGWVFVPFAALGMVVPASAAEAPVCVAGPDPYHVELVPTAHANGSRGEVTLRFADSPFGVTVTGSGHHAYDAVVKTERLAGAGRSLVVWAASPELDQVVKLGVLDETGAVSGRIALNKFLVFVTAEATADVERWSGPILLRGISPSGRLHTMAGHGPFQTESCASYGFGGPVRDEASS